MLKKMRPNQLRAILIFLITPTRWQFAGYPFTTGTQKAAKLSNKNSSFNWVHSILTESMNASHSTNFFHKFMPPYFQATPHCHVNLQHPTIPLFALTNPSLCKKRVMLKKTTNQSQTNVGPMWKTRNSFEPLQRINEALEDARNEDNHTANNDAG